MIDNDKQLGKPLANYINTKANINAIVPSNGMVAYATDTGETGRYTSAGWIWVPLKAFSASVSRYNAQTISNNTWTAISFEYANWDNVSSDVSLHWSATSNPTRLTSRSGGIYVITASVTFDTNVTGVRGVSIRYNGSQYHSTQVIPAYSGDLHVSTSAILDLGGGSIYVEMMVFQNSGGDLNAIISHNTPEFSFVKVQV